MNFFIGINKYISWSLNKFVISNNLKWLIWIFSDLPIFFLPWFLIFSRLYFTFKSKNEKKKINLLFIFYSTLVAISINLIVQQFIILERPETYINPILKHVPDNSFPSDHAAVSFAFLFWLYFFWFEKTFWLFSIFVIIMNFSRIAWWLHWFFDVVVWLLIWAFSAYLIYKIKNCKIIKKINKLIFKIAKTFKL